MFSPKDFVSYNNECFKYVGEAKTQEEAENFCTAKNSHLASVQDRSVLFVCVFMSVWVCVWVCECVGGCMCVWVCVCVCQCLRTFALHWQEQPFCLCTGLVSWLVHCVSVCVCASVCVCLCLCVCVCVSVFGNFCSGKNSHLPLYRTGQLASSLCVCVCTWYIYYQNWALGVSFYFLF